MPDFTAKELRNKTAEELAILEERYFKQSAEGILIESEKIRRRAAHSFREKILLAILVVLLGVALKVFLTSP